MKLFKNSFRKNTTLTHEVLFPTSIKTPVNKINNILGRLNINKTICSEHYGNQGWYVVLELY